MWDVGHGTVFLFGAFLIISGHLALLLPVQEGQLTTFLVTIKNIPANLQTPSHCEPQLRFHSL